MPDHAQSEELFALNDACLYVDEMHNRLRRGEAAIDKSKPVPAALAQRAPAAPPPKQLDPVLIPFAAGTRSRHHGDMHTHTAQRDIRDTHKQIHTTHTPHTTQIHTHPNPLVAPTPSPAPAQAPMPKAPPPQQIYGISVAATAAADVPLLRPPPASAPGSSNPIFASTAPVSTQSAVPAARASSQPAAPPAVEEEDEFAALARRPTKTAVSSAPAAQPMLMFPNPSPSGADVALCIVSLFVVLCFVSVSVSVFVCL